ncbi:MAG: VOC family protein [Lachnospiraceae bacterium]|nr:VOC family protein [Lachnospiraceae bacterium]MDD3660540.1 VOC family protein [Lachnospiraceae bacterium]
MQKIIPHLWYDKEALEAASWYVSLFGNSKILHTVTLSDTPSGDAQMVAFELEGISFSAISAGPYFTFNPAISIFVTCQTRKELEKIYDQLKDGATFLMPLDEYPFSNYYVWLQDKYGLSWQLILNEQEQNIPKIRPALLFSGESCGRALEAMKYYTSLFPQSNINFVNHYGVNEAEDKRAMVNYAEMDLYGTSFIIMDHGSGGDFCFNEAFSLMVPCDNQDEIDYYWDKLSYVPEAEQCGWLKDQFGLSWQITPANMDEIFVNGTPDEAKRATEAFLKMKKFDLAALEKARTGMNDE